MRPFGLVAALLRCDSEGHFSLRPNWRVWLHLSTEERFALAEEIAAQVRRCQTHGLPLTHADSHGFVHVGIPAILSVMAPVLRARGVRAVRLARNMWASSMAARLAKAAYNRWLRQQGFWTTELFGTLRDALPYLASAASPSKSVEVMVHPSYGAGGQLLDVTLRPHVPLLPEAFGGKPLSPYPTVGPCDR